MEQEEQKTLIKDLMMHIKSINKYMTEQVLLPMNLLCLLRNAHPLYREDYARKMKNLQLLSKWEADEFIQIINRNYTR